MTTPNALIANGGRGSDAKTINFGGTSMLNISDASAFCIPEGYGVDGRLSIAPSDLGQSLMPFLSVEMSAVESQCDLWSVAEMA